MAFLTCSKTTAIDQFTFQLRENTFRRRVVRARSHPTHADRQTMVFETVPIDLTGVLAAVVGMQNRAFTVKA